MTGGGNACMVPSPAGSALGEKLCDLEHLGSFFFFSLREHALKDICF